MKDANLFRCKDSVYLREVSNKAEALAGFGKCDGFLIRGSEKIARSIIASLKGKKFSGKIGIFGGDDAFNRRAVESLEINYLVSVEALVGRDTLKQRDSGLNHVVARIAKEKGICVVVGIGEVSKLEEKKKAKRIAKIMQNVKICRKVGCRILIASLGRNKGEVFDEKGRKSFGVGLGMSSDEVRDCVRF